MSETTESLNLSDPIYARLEDQIGWYDRKASSAQHTFKRIKIVEILAAALIPFLAALNVYHKLAAAVTLVTGGLGVVITILEGSSAPESVSAAVDFVSIHVRGAETREVHIPGPRGTVRECGRSACHARRACRDSALAGKRGVDFQPAAGSQGYELRPKPRGYFSRSS